jgi:aryl-alcohol dehydrogenase-like predicted oxidoreductase
MTGTHACGTDAPAAVASSYHHLVRPLAELGGECTSETQREIIRRAFDRGSTHFDLANNYGPPWGRRSRTSAVSLQQAWPEIATN